MSAKKKMSEQEIINRYMEGVMSEESMPQTVYGFAKKNNFQEAEFYEYFNGFDHLEEEVFALFGKNTLSLLEKSDQYSEYEAQQKLLGFYFTFFEMLTANRSYVMTKLADNKDHLSALKSLKGLKGVFKSFTDGLGIGELDFRNEQINRLRDKGVSESLWIQLLVTMKFWMDDRSKGFEKTDVFIEKSIRAQFDLLDTTPVKSVFDLAKFLWKENSMV
ncbi:MAG: TetR family transcriptional regulator C-terminal domain-containing protein [Flavobacteriaceae bacterium]